MSLQFEEEDPNRSSSVNDIRIEITDDEIKKLSQYFQNSREEIQKKVDSLLAFEIPAPKKIIKSPSSEKDLNSRSKSQQGALVGTPIDLETATLLRKYTVGSCVHSFSDQWRRAKFVFREENSEITYGLWSDKNGSKGLIMSVQAIVLKNFMLNGYTDIEGNPVINSDWRNERRILKPTENEKREILIKSLSEILWKVGENKRVTVVLNSLYNCFELSFSTTTKSNYIGDGLTERLHLYEFTDYKSLELFIRKNLNIFQKEDGCLVFLYSLILSRTVENLEKDLQGSVLIGQMEDCKMSLYNLVLTGVATPHVHNGTTYYDKNGQSLEKPIVGIKNRNDVGMLFWDPKEENNARTEVGSMLKTPKYPIWLAIMGKNQLAILFNTNIDLMNNWRLEQMFTLHFYSALKKQETQITFTIETRELSGIQQLNLKSKYSKFNFNEEEKESEIVKLINTKWASCEITDVDGKELMNFL